MLKRIQQLSQRLAPIAPPALPAPVRQGVPWEDARVMHILGSYGTSEPGGLVFAMDATFSRSATWAEALSVQGSMFQALGPGLKVQLVYFRGGEFYASRWTRHAAGLAKEMRSVCCKAGTTQIARVLSHGESMAAREGARALVYVGDAMEEDADLLLGHAAKLAQRCVPLFVFQEGADARAQTVFQELARVTKGAYARFDEMSANRLKDLLSAAAVYAGGGRGALAALAKAQPAARMLLEQMK
jgi:hypothetical protein